MTEAEELFRILWSELDLTTTLSMVAMDLTPKENFTLNPNLVYFL